MVVTSLIELGERAKQASRALALASTGTKDAALAAGAEPSLAKIRRDRKRQSGSDVARAEADGVSATIVDRLRLSEARLASMADGLHQVAAAWPTL